MTISMKQTLPLPKDAAQGKRFAIVASRYHEEITQELLAGALSALKSFGARPEDIYTVWVPGAFEIPLAARACTQHQSVDAVICLGVIIKGETSHNEYIARETAQGIAQLGYQTGIPIIFGVLTPDTVEQALARAGGKKGNKGIEAAEAAVSMIQALEQIKKDSPKPSKSVGFGNL